MQVSVRRYSAIRRRSLIAMVARRALLKVNGSASSILVKPFVVMAAPALCPRRRRLRLVKLAHNLDSDRALATTGLKGYDVNQAVGSTPMTAAAALLSCGS